ncbi:MAG: hypothetical protein ACRDLB_11510 [Actinomycetota bacterium]
MKRALASVTGSGFATAAIASSLSVLVAATLIAGGVVVSRVSGGGGGASVAALPATTDPSGPIVIPARAARQDRSTDLSAFGAEETPGAGPASLSAPVTRTVALVDIERVRGKVSRTVEKGSGRMREIGTIERIGSIIEDSTDAHTGGSTTTGSEDAQTAPDEPDERTILPDDDLSDIAVEEPSTAPEPVYSAIEAGSASPAA